MTSETKLSKGIVVSRGRHSLAVTGSPGTLPVVSVLAQALRGMRGLFYPSLVASSASLNAM